MTAPETVRRHLGRVSLLICVDGGLRAARRLGVRPHVAVGDFDSASPALRTWAVRRGARLIEHPVQKDKTDAELAVEVAAARGVREILFFGAMGGRLDHELANVALLLRARARGVAMQIIDGDTTVLLAGRRTALAARPGDIVSLLPVSRQVTGVTTSGLAYPLARATLYRGRTLGVSNAVVGPRPAVRRTTGDLLIVLIHRGTRVPRRS